MDAKLLEKIAPFISPAVQFVEAIFVKPGVKLGVDKQDTVTQILNQVITGMSQAKIPLSDGSPVPATVPTDDLHTAIDTVVAQMKAAGQFTGTLGTSTPDPLWLVQGKVTQLQNITLK